MITPQAEGDSWGCGVEDRLDREQKEGQGVLQGEGNGAWNVAWETDRRYLALSELARAIQR